MHQRIIKNKHIESHLRFKLKKKYFGSILQEKFAQKSRIRENKPDFPGH